MNFLKNCALLWAGIFLVIGLGLNEVVISRLKGADLSNLTLLTLRGFNIYFAAIGLLLFAYSQREDWRAHQADPIWAIYDHAALSHYRCARIGHQDLGTDVCGDV